MDYQIYNIRNSIAAPEKEFVLAISENAVLIPAIQGITTSEALRREFVPVVILNILDAPSMFIVSEKYLPAVP